MASRAAVPIRTAIVNPTMTPVERAVPMTLRIAILVLRHREGHHHAHPSALCGRYLCLAAKLHGKAANKGQAEAAAKLGAGRPAGGGGGIVLDGQLHSAGLVCSLDADLEGRTAVESTIERAADRFGDDQADGNGDVGADRHDRGADVITRLRPVGPASSDRDLANQVAAAMLEGEEPPAQALAEMARQDRS